MLKCVLVVFSTLYTHCFYNTASSIYEKKNCTVLLIHNPVHYNDLKIPYYFIKEYIYIYFEESRIQSNKCHYVQWYAFRDI